MRPRERIRPFMEELTQLWETVPDWRFGQLMVNLFGTFQRDPFFYEDEETLKQFKKFFKDNGFIK